MMKDIFEEQGIELRRKTAFTFNAIFENSLKRLIFVAMDGELPRGRAPWLPESFRSVRANTVDPHHAPVDRLRVYA